MTGISALDNVMMLGLIPQSAGNWLRSIVSPLWACIVISSRSESVPLSWQFLTCQVMGVVEPAIDDHAWAANARERHSASGPFRGMRPCLLAWQVKGWRYDFIDLFRWRLF